MRWIALHIGSVLNSFRGAAVLSLLLGCAMLVIGAGEPSLAQASGFGIVAFDGTATTDGGAIATQAGSHPDLTTTIEFPKVETSEGSMMPDGNAKDVHVALPAGLIGNANATPRCTTGQLAIGVFGGCPDSTQIGHISLIFTNGGNFNLPVYNLIASPGVPAEFGFQLLGVVTLLKGTVLGGPDHRIGVDIENISQSLPVYKTVLTLWGVPASASHDSERGVNGSCNDGGTVPCPAHAPVKPFITFPTSCEGPTTTVMSADSWQEPTVAHTVSFVSHDLANPPNEVANFGCNSLPFAPSFTAQATSSNADSPSGLAVAIHLPQNENGEGLAEADLKGAAVTLPQGMSVNPSSANGLAACSEAEIEVESTQPARCPDASKLGAVEITSPLLEQPLKGGVYLARQGENRFGSLLAVYIAVEGEGVVIKLPGKIETTSSGQVTATFDNNPQLPFEDLQVEFFGGPRAALVTPPTCGTYTTSGEFTPWSGTPPVTSTSSFQITSGPNGSACPNGSFAPKLEAGTTNPVAGKYSPFVLNLSREDGTQQLSTITAALPKGLLGKLAGIPYCSDSALGGIPTAEGTGAAQLANPSCPSASQLGTVSVGAGAGPSPFFVNTGKVYLAGPYRGAPLSLAIVTPALAGPFDLGNVVVRAALQVNAETTQITAVSDPLPTILHGIPLDLRSVAVNINREGFTLNPTSCNPMEVSSTIGGTQGAIAHPSSRFQVASCESLGFAPKLDLNLKGATKRAKDPALKAVLTAPSGQSNIGKVQVILPKSVFIDQSHVGNPCTRVQFNEGAGNGSACPAKSILGKATAYSPLLSEPLTGLVYFRSNGGERKLPDLVASLNGQIHVNLVGFIDSVHQKGTEGSRVRNTFTSVPDAPVSRFVLELQGGKKGLLQNSTNLCKTTNKATVKMDGQNGKAADFETVVKPVCGSKKKSKPKKK